jgi:hypothetical protein
MRNGFVKRSGFVVWALAMLVAGSASEVQAQQPAGQPRLPAGTWKGTLEAARLTVVFHIASTPEGGFSATMDSPDQGARGIPVSRVTFADSTLTLVVEAVRGEFQGRIGPDGKFSGQWRQGGAALPLILERAAPAKSPDLEE